VCIKILFPTPLFDELGVRLSHRLLWRLSIRLVCIQRREHLLICAPQRID
jgi:hypothetical protein